MNTPHANRSPDTRNDLKSKVLGQTHIGMNNFWDTQDLSLGNL